MTRTTFLNKLFDGGIKGVYFTDHEQSQGYNGVCYQVIDIAGGGSLLTKEYRFDGNQGTEMPKSTKRTLSSCLDDFVTSEDILDNLKKALAVNPRREE